jgi:hypothetical protein
MDTPHKHTPKPDEIKSIVVVDLAGHGITYFDLLDAITDVYRLTPDVRDHIRQIVITTSEQK